MLGSMTASAEFVITVTGERLRMLVGNRLKAIDAAEQRAHSRLERVTRLEQEREHHESAMRRVLEEAGAGPATRHGVVGQMGLGGFVAPIETVSPVERQEGVIRQLATARAELLWLHDSINPTTEYKLNRGDLALFGNFGEADLGSLAALVGDGMRAGLGCC